MTLRLMIADDELLARKRLTRLIEALGDVELVRACESGQAVLEALKEEPVDVLLLESELVLGGTRAFPSDLYDHGFQRMEIPLGPFERRVALPPGDYRIVRREAWRGCLLLRLERLQVSPEADPAEG